MNKDANYNRRNFLVTAGKVGLASGLGMSILPSIAATGSNAFVAAQSTPYQQQPLPYAYNALEPAIDAMTMEIHYSKHAATYAKTLAEAMDAEKVDRSKTTLEQLLGNVSKYSAKIRNNAGGHYNHELFWKLMAPPSGNNAPTGKLLSAIQKDFSSVDAFKTQFAEAAKTRFGSGWAWLVATPGKKLVITSTPNQDNPLMNVSEVKGFPILGLDVWEHAYYLKYQNKRPDYITAWWQVVNWSAVDKRLADMK